MCQARGLGAETSEGTEEGRANQTSEGVVSAPTLELGKAREPAHSVRIRFTLCLTGAELPARLRGNS